MKETTTRYIIYHIYPEEIYEKCTFESEQEAWEFLNENAAFLSRFQVIAIEVKKAEKLEA